MAVVAPHLAPLLLSCALAGPEEPASDVPVQRWGVRYIVDYAQFELLRMSREEWAQPYINQQGRLFFVGTRTGRLEARLVASGERVWAKNGLGNFGARMTEWKSHLIVGIDSALVALDQDTGERVFEVDLDGRIAGAIERVGSTVVVPIRPNSYVAVDLEERSLRWRLKRPTPENLTVRGQGGAYVDERRDLVVMGFSDGTLLGATLSGGDTKWLARLGKAGEFFRDVDTTPVPADDGESLLVASYNAGLYKVDTDRGTIIYERPLGRVHSMTRAEPLDTLVLVTGDGEVLGFDEQAARLVWRYRVKEGFPSHPISTGDGYVLVVTSEGALSIIDARRGQPQQLLAPGSGASIPVMVRGTDALVLSNKALLLVLGKNRGQNLSGVLPKDPGPAERFGAAHEQ